jgi:hypothetical protein
MSASDNEADDAVDFGPAGGGGILVVSDPLSLGAGSGTATITVPAETPAGDYWVIAPGTDPNSETGCIADFTVTG